ncbi:MAG: amidohydrolase family protein [Sedimentisphaerales bacterium]|nr:amidohydrolase family protein [Sedimentisphaerales bacterium]
MEEARLTEVDEFIYNKEIRPLLPERVFDAHSHLHKSSLHPGSKDLSNPNNNLEKIDMSCLQNWWRVLFPDSKVSGLVLGHPRPLSLQDIKAENEFLAENTSAHKDCRFSILASPQLSAEQMEKQILELKPTGLKPYMVFAQVPEKNLASITQMIPEEQIALADKYGLTITLHVAKPRGMADDENLDEITRLTKQYPNCNFILAHCGRCFITPNAEDMLKRLPVAENLWLDTSAVCDIGVFFLLLQEYDTSRILFGTDLVEAAAFRGTYVRLGMTWDMCTAQMVFREKSLHKIRATFAAYENLSAMLYAAKFSKTSSKDLENIFYNNAAGLFGIDKS